MFVDRPKSGSSAILVDVEIASESNQVSPAERTREAVELVVSAGISVLGCISGSRKAPAPKTFIGSGKVAEIAEALTQNDADLVIFNHELSPGQQRNLEKIFACQVLTRTELILDIFAQRARTHEGKLQVELAQVTHAQSRLVRGWSHLDRQKGGIGLRGAGEKQIEMDQRMLSVRLANIKKRLAGVQRQRKQSRMKRSRAAVPTVALVGYTNAGKSTLFNQLTQAEVYVQDQLFATLDPTLRRLNIPGLGDIVLADTVGFISALPHGLVAAFKATLEEVVSADLLLHVVDSSAEFVQERKQQVLDVLNEIGASGRPMLEVYNKIDISGLAPGTEMGADGNAARVGLSAVSKEISAHLISAIGQRLGVRAGPVRVRLEASAGRVRSWLYDIGAVIDEQVEMDGSLALSVRVDNAGYARLQQEAGVMLQNGDEQ
ncbi:MAG: GTPase HflX [Pseudomonadales bacterium]|nr:GTPase HflX [Pseudomonadales bacterium]